MPINFTGLNSPDRRFASVDLSLSAPAAAMKKFIDEAVDHLQNLGGIVTPEAVKAYLRDVKHMKPIGAACDNYIKVKINDIKMKINDWKNTKGPSKGADIAR